MPVIISAPDALRQSVEAATGGRNTVVYDDKGHPSIMVVIPRFLLQDVDASLGNGTHPAFMVAGQARPEILVGKFLACIHDNRPVALPRQRPAWGLRLDEARALCAAKGPGWHLATNAEWAAVALLSWKAARQPRGNTEHGRSAAQKSEVGRRIDGRTPGDAGFYPVFGYTGSQTLTGSGPLTWSHDHSESGVFDLVGNVGEWVAGLRLRNGEINVIPGNDSASPDNDEHTNSLDWRAITAADGSLVAPGTAGTLKFDMLPPVGGFPVPQLDVQVTASTAQDQTGIATFRTLAVEAGVNVPSIMRALCIAPLAAGLGEEQILVNNNEGEQLASRGGAYSSGAGAGLFALNFNTTRAWSSGSHGFRPCYLPQAW